MAVPPLPLSSHPDLAGWELECKVSDLAGEQCWQPALLRLARRGERLHWFAALLQESYGLQPPGRHEHEKYL